MTSPSSWYGLAHNCRIRAAKARRVGREKLSILVGQKIGLKEVGAAGIAANVAEAGGTIATTTERWGTALKISKRDAALTNRFVS